MRVKVKPGVEYGYHFEGCNWMECSEVNLWSLLQFAFIENEDNEDATRSIRVGEVKYFRLGDFFDADVVMSMLEDGRELLLGDVLRAIGEGLDELLEDAPPSCACLFGSLAEQQEATKEFSRIVRKASAATSKGGRLAVARRVVAWAARHVILEPEGTCSGVYPMPLELIDGEWHFGRKRPSRRSRITIDYAFDEMEELGGAEPGSGRWLWKAGGQKGECYRLERAIAEAQQAAEKESTWKFEMA